MPDFAILNNQVIKVNDIYKFNINKKSKFTCYTCGKELQFRQSRNAPFIFIIQFNIRIKNYI